MTVKTWQAGSSISSAKMRAYHSLTSGVSGTAERWKALVLWKARGTMVVRDGIAEGFADVTERVVACDDDDGVVMLRAGLGLETGLA
jgi:hypothetical protein